MNYVGKKIHLLWILLTFTILLYLWNAPTTPEFDESTVSIDDSNTVYTLNTIKSEYAYPLNNTSLSDYSHLIDLEDFNFSVINMPCMNSSPLLLVTVQSAPKNFRKRIVIRETWATTEKERVKVIFMLGKVQDLQLRTRLERENREHKDLIQGHFVDAYKNMTYKHVMALKYAIYHCPNAKYVLKVDDDVFVNMPALVNFLNVKLSPYGASKLLLCTPLVNLKVERSYRSKWRVAFSEYSNRYYPPYCPGWALLYSADVVFDLYTAAQNSSYFWIDDVHLTGTLANKLNLKHTSIDSLIMPYSDIDDIMNGVYNGSISFLYGRPDIPESKIRALWDFVSDTWTFIH